MVMVCCLVLGGAGLADTPTDTDTIFVARRGWHIDVGFMVDELALPLRFIRGEFPGARYVFFGFGDRRYLESRNRGVPLMLLALLPGRGLMLGTGLTAGPGTAFGTSQVIALSVPHEAAVRAQGFVWHTLSDSQEVLLRLRDSEHRAPVGMPGPYEGSSFFDSRGRYSAAHTCNTWAAEVLAQVGVPLPSRRIIFAGQLWRRLERLEAQQRTLPVPN
jgi:hypothetical protein